MTDALRMDTRQRMANKRPIWPALFSLRDNPTAKLLGESYATGQPKADQPASCHCCLPGPQARFSVTSTVANHVLKNFQCASAW